MTKEELCGAACCYGGRKDGMIVFPGEQALLRRLELPEHLTANGLLEALNLLYGREAFLAWMAEDTEGK